MSLLGSMLVGLNATPSPALADVSAPSWWSGECNVNNHSGSYALGASYNGVKACGPGAYNQGGYDQLVRFFPGAWGEYEWECVELVMRYMYQVYGVAPYNSPGGKDVVGNYSGNVLVPVTNNGTSASPKLPSPGDIISVGASASNQYGHTAVVTAVGPSSITIMQQNATANGWGTLAVSGGKVTGTVLGGGVTGWLHSPGNGTSAPTHNAGGYVATETNSDGTVELFGIGNDNNVYAKRETAANVDAWNGWYQLQGGNAKSIAATHLANGKLAVFFVSADGGLHYYYQTAASVDSWTAMQAMNTGLNHIAATTNADGTVELFAVGNDGNLYANRETAANVDAWNGWYQLQGGNAISITATQYADGRIGAFFVSADGSVHYYNQASASNDTWTAMQAITAGLVGINANTNADGTVELFAVGNDGNNYAKHETSANVDSWGGWYQLQGGTSSSIASGKLQNGRLEVFFVAGDGAPRYYYQTSPSVDSWSAMQMIVAGLHT